MRSLLGLEVEKMKLRWEDISDYPVAMKCKERIECKTNEEFQEKQLDFPDRFYFGVTSSTIRFDERDDVVNHIAIHYCLSVCNEEMAAVS